jgi:hypothetical protein
MNGSSPHVPPDQDAARPKRPYQTPRLQVFGAVAALTQTLNMSGSQRDGGPNNTKSF